MADGLPLECPEQAVNNLEAGIRTLAGQLCLQIDEVSTKTTTSFRELATARAKAAELLSRAENLVDDMTRLRAETQDARDAAVAAFSEAKKLREETRRAQERADASASQPSAPLIKPSERPIPPRHLPGKPCKRAIGDRATTQNGTTKHPSVAILPP